MCGIIGYSSKSPLNPDKILYLMYYNSIERGRHSTGFYTPETGVKKDSKTPEDFLSDNPIPLSNTFIGHVRMATVGARTKSNSHPFEFDNLVGVHNGTLDNHWAMLSQRIISNKGIDVDSQALYKCLDEDSKANKIIYGTLSDFDGAAALLFQDKRNTKVIYAYRNNDRPLFYGMIDKSMYISSLPNSLKIIGCKNVELFSENFLYKIEDGKILSRQFYKEFIKPKPVHKHIRTFRKNDNINGDVLKQLQLAQQCGEHDDEDSRLYAKRCQSVSDDTFLSNIDKSKDYNNVDFVGKWLMCLHGNVTRYLKNPVSFTKGDWYFVEDYSVENNYDIVVKDDELNEVVIGKWIFDMNYVVIEEYVVSMNIITEQLNPMNTIYREDEVIEVYDSNKVKSASNKDCVELYDSANDRTRLVPISSIRPATTAEIALFSKNNEDKKATDNSCPFVPDIKAMKEADQSVKNFFDGIDDEPSQNIDRDKSKDKKEVREVEELVPTDLYDFALDIIDEKVTIIAELVETTNFKELKEEISELCELVEDLYSLEKLQSYKNDYEKDLINEKNTEDIIIT